VNRLASPSVIAKIILQISGTFFVQTHSWEAGKRIFGMFEVGIVPKWGAQELSSTNSWDPTISH